MPIRELHVSYTNRGPAEEEIGPVAVKNARDVVALMGPLLERETVEVCYVLCLTSPLGLIGYHQVSRGSLDQAPVVPREVYKAAMLVNAASVVLVHNHPSGDPTPSGDDLAITSRVRAAGRLIGIELLDHIIVGHQGRYTSLKDEGRL